MSLKIAIAVNHYHPSIGGAEIVCQTIAEYLAKYHKVFIFTRKLAKSRNPQNYQYKIFEYTNIIGFEKQLNLLAPDVVLVYSDMFDFFRPLILLKRKPYKLIIALCGANWLYSQRNYINTLYRNRQFIHSIICHSKHERDYKICSSINLINKTVIIPNGVWIEEFASNNLTRQNLAPQIMDKRWILNISNFFPGKGQEHLTKIISYLPEPDKIAYIQISSTINFSIGEYLESRWHTYCQSLRKKKIAVKLFKNIKRHNVIGFLKQSNVFVFPSEKEVAPLVLLESMAASLPWVASNIGNAIELTGGKCIPSIKDSRFHSVFDNRTCKLFANAIQDLWNNPDLGKQGKKYIEEKLNWNNILPEYLKLIEK